MPLTEMLAKQAALAAQCPAATRLPEAEAAKLPIHVDRCGTTGPRILIIHGGVQGNVGGGPATFIKQRELCERNWRVEIVDRPGFGQSPSRGVDDMEADAVWIADLLGDGAHLLGHSWGGAEVLLAAARRPEAVRSLTFVEPALQALAAVSGGDGKPGASASMMQEMEDMILNSSTPAEYMRRFLESLKIAQTIGKLDESTLNRLGCSMLQARMAPPKAFQEAVATITEAAIPVLAISGGWSEAVDEVTRTIARLTGGQYVRVASSNHYPQLENSGEFNQALETFLHDQARALA